MQDLGKVRKKKGTEAFPRTSERKKEKANCSGIAKAFQKRNNKKRQQLNLRLDTNTNGHPNRLKLVLLFPFLPLVDFLLLVHA